MALPFLEETIAVLERTPAVLDGLLRGLPEPWVSADEGPGTWTPYGVVGHLIHGEKVDWMLRLGMILEFGSTRTFPAFDREAQNKTGTQTPLPVLLDEFRSLRMANLERLRSLDLREEQLSRTGSHPTFGPVTARQLLATWAAHDLDHLVQIARVMGKRLKEDVGPWAAFLSVMK